MTGTTSPFGVSAAKPILKYFFKTRFSPPTPSEELKRGKSRSASRHPLTMFASAASRLEIRTVRILVLSHMRQIDPAGLKPGSRNLLDPGQWLDFDGPELAEVHDRHLGQCRAARRGRGRGLRGRQNSFHMRLHILLCNAVLDAGSLDPPQ